MSPIPLCPPFPPFGRNRIRPVGRSMSSYRTSKSVVGSRLGHRSQTASAVAPERFMYVRGFANRHVRPWSSTQATSASNSGSSRQITPARSARQSTIQKPTLWRVAEYCSPGFPSPTINISGVGRGVEGESPLCATFAAAFRGFLSPRNQRDNHERNSLNLPTCQPYPPARAQASLCCPRPVPTQYPLNRTSAVGSFGDGFAFGRGFFAFFVGNFATLFGIRKTAGHEHRRDGQRIIGMDL